MKHTRLFAGAVIALSLCLLLVLGDRPALGASAATPTMTPVDASGLVLRVTRFEPSVSNPTPFERTIEDAAAIQALYQAALALPPAPFIRMRCLQMGVTYHLVIYQDGRIVHIIDTQPNGCSLTTVYPAYTRETTPAFRALLGTTLGVSTLVPTPA
jgi:hypothetical protein